MPQAGWSTIRIHNHLPVVVARFKVQGIKPPIVENEMGTKMEHEVETSSVSTMMFHGDC